MIFVAAAHSTFAQKSRAVVRSVEKSPRDAHIDAGKYEGRNISAVEIAIEGAPPNPDIENNLRAALTVAPNTSFSSVRVRESLENLFKSGRVSRARVEVYESGANDVRLRFVAHLQLLVSSVEIQFDTAGAAQNNNAAVSVDDIRGRVNLLQPGARVTESALRSNADAIAAYLRDRGYYRAEVNYTTQPDATGTRAVVSYRIRLNEQARVANFTIDIPNFSTAKVYQQLTLKPNAVFSRVALNNDVERIRQALISEGYLAPQLSEPQTTINETGNAVTITLKGTTGPKVNVAVHGYKISSKTEQQLLPIEREGTIDPSAIEEGRRRLQNKLEQDGYFFANVSYSCSVLPSNAAARAPTNNTTSNAANNNVSNAANANAANNSQDTCETLNPSDLNGRTVEIAYNIEPGRRFKLTDIRIEGTNKLIYDDVSSSLRSREANALGFIPILGYGHGYTSSDLLEQDRQTIQNRMRQDLGYLQATVSVRQGVSLNGDDLIITFVVNEGPLTRVNNIQIVGNKIFTADKLNQERCTPPPTATNIIVTSRAGEVAAGANNAFEACNIKGAPYSQTLARTERNRLIDFYSRNGYTDTKVQFSTQSAPDAPNGDKQINLIYTITEGSQSYINHIVVNGLQNTKRAALLRAITLREGDVLRPDQITESERILYATDAFNEVTIRAEPSVETANGIKKQDVIINVTERQPHVLDYGGGYSTDNGPLGIFEIQDTNLRGTLKQGAIRTRASGNRQLVRLEYFDPRFYRYGTIDDPKKTYQFAPLTLALQYQRDTSVTRFFRSTIDRGNGGVVQFFDQQGNLVNQFGQPAGVPSVNRFTFSAETQRVIDPRSRSILFLRYAYEDVRLFNIESLLIQPILQPDRVVRLSRFGASFARDTRDRQLDSTRGSFLTADYSVSMRQLGGNISFNKFQTAFSRYQKLDFLSSGQRETVLAGNLQFGVANIFNPRDRNQNGIIDQTDQTLPISERFFSGGSTTLRGFGFEEAGPRAAIVPPPRQFFDQNGKPVTLIPFAVPIGGNALLALNLEARIGVTKIIQIVPFYDGGNVFQSIHDIFKHPERQVINVGAMGTQASMLDAAIVRSEFSHTVGLGLRFKTPFGPLAVDYGYQLNPMEFVLQQQGLPDSLIRIKRTQIHFRFGQTF
jgi:outer membrane protein insertion porin family